MSESYHQACVVPYRKTETGFEYCLVTSTNSGDWIFPKGNIDYGETPQESGLKEAFEEAGLFGEIEGGMIGEFEYQKLGRMWLRTAVYLMRVDLCEEHWQEEEMRKRVWQTGAQALESITRDFMQDMLRKAMAQLGDK